MKTRVLLLGFILILFSGSIPAFGANLMVVNGRNMYQPPRGQQMTPEERAKRETDWMKSNLELTDQQLSKVDSINLKYALKQKELRENLQDEFQSIRPEMEKLRNQKNDELKLILSDGQMKKYLEFLAQRRGRMGGRSRN